MSRLIRCLLVWLLALALPLQGVAAASMRHCAPAGDAVHGQAAQAGGHGLSSAPHAHQADHGAAHGHAAAAAADQAEDAPATALPEAKCSACAACCAALGLPAVGVKLPSPPGADDVARPAPAGVDSFVANGLDRPPRLPRA
jgi:hypothetical protein